MPPAFEMTRNQARYVWRYGKHVYVSFPTLPRAFAALCKLGDQARLAEYDGHRSGRHWIRFQFEPLAEWPAEPPFTP